MRITFLSPGFADLSGGSLVCHIHADALQRRGHDVTIVAPPRPPASWWRRLAAAARPKPMPASLFTGGYRKVVAAQPGLIGAHDVPDADVIVATWWETAEWMLALPREKGAHAHFVQGLETFPFVPRDRVEAVLAAPSAKITISGWLEGVLRDTYGNTDVTVIPNSVDTALFDAPPRDRSTPPTVGLLYSIFPDKGTKTGIAAFERLRRRLPDARLLSFGRGALLPDCPLPDGAVHVSDPAGPVIRDIYATCDAWLCPSLSEGFGLTIMEAMACRAVPVTTPVGGPLDFVGEGVNGRFVPFGDADAMADRLHEVLTMPPAAWRAMSDAAHATAHGFSWDAAADRFAATLARVAGHAGGPTKDAG